MGSKYKIRKTDLKAFYAMTDQYMETKGYHEIYKELGWEQGANGNFHCWNSAAHGRGTDNNPSMSVNDKTGQWHCFSCSIGGNFQSYWKEVLRGDPRYGDSYSDFVIDLLHLNTTDVMRFSEDFKDKEFEENREKMMRFAERLSQKYEQDHGRYLMTSDLKELLKEEVSIPKETVDALVQRLKANPDKMQYLKQTRNVTESIIDRLRLGLDEKNRFTIPIFDAEGNCLNIKIYDPFNPNIAFKWKYWAPGLPIRPLPVDNLTKQKIYIFEGEPDMLCAIGFGIEGAVTMGSKSNKDVNAVFGPEMAHQIFYNKEVVIVFDTDNEPDKYGKTSQQTLAHSLYPYAKQVKVVNLDYDEQINPTGLDPSLMKKVVNRAGIEKDKRAEKDFTEFITKNGFNKQAVENFHKLVELTEVYIENENRTREVVCKVTIQEARMAKQYSPDGSKILELVASVSDFDSTAYQYPKSFCVACPQMNCDEGSKMPGSCKRCMMPAYPGFFSKNNIVIHFHRKIPEEYKGDRRHIKISEHNILGLVQVTDAQKRFHHKRLIGINPRCDMVDVTDLAYEKLLHVRLVKDVSEYGDPATSGIHMEAYMVGDQDIYANKSYKFKAVHTTSWVGQYAVLFAHEAEPTATSIENFKMNEETHNILMSFRRKAGESIEQHLQRRYKIFGNAAGITGRDDLFLICDLAFFSTAEIHNKTLLPKVTRGYVESFIAGESRCGKTIAAKFLHDHYKIGEFISGSGAVSRTGLLGGITSFKNSQSISWGKIPANDGGIITIDELSIINYESFDSLTPCRSSGVADVQMVKSGKVPARTRKIMLSNPRGNADTRKEHQFPYLMLKDICFGKDEILSRFDIGYVVTQADVEFDRFASSYDQISTEFTEFQCQTLIKWCYSRKPEDIVLEDGLEEYITSEAGKLLKKFHPSTHLVNIEMRAKILRMSVSIATMLYSIPPDNDWNKIYVIKEHVDFICQFIMRIYCHPNMALDRYSEVKYASERLGDMKFMEGIMSYVGIEQLIREDEFTEASLRQIFFDYLYAVTSGNAAIVDANDDANRSTSYKYVNDACHKLIGVLCARNCLVRMKRGLFKKTPMFSKWLMTKKDDDYGGSDFLDVTPDELASQMDKKIKRFESTSDKLRKQKRDQDKGMEAQGA